MYTCTLKEEKVAGSCCGSCQKTFAALNKKASELNVAKISSNCRRNLKSQTGWNIFVFFYIKQKIE